jgi:hypothetical protein
MIRPGIVAFIVVVVGIFVSACGGDAKHAPPGPQAPIRTPTSQAPSSPNPPHSTLTLGTRTITGVLGSYCWESVSGAAETFARCADAAGMPIPRQDEALTVPRGWVLVFDYGGKGRPASVGARAYPLEQKRGAPPGRTGGALLVPRAGRPALEANGLGVNRLGDRAQVPVKLSAGEYVVEISIVVPEGDAAYYFRVVVP